MKLFLAVIVLAVLALLGGCAFAHAFLPAPASFNDLPCDRCFAGQAAPSDAGPSRQFALSTIPEPVSATLILLGACGLLAKRFRHRGQ